MKIYQLYFFGKPIFYIKKFAVLLKLVKFSERQKPKFRFKNITTEIIIF